MYVPDYLRMDSGNLSTTTKDTLRPYVVIAIEYYLESFKNTYSTLRSLDEIVDNALNEVKFLLINEEYLIAYTIQSSWLSPANTLNEEFIMRVSQGSTTSLTEVVELLTTLSLLNGCEAIEVSTAAIENKEAGRRLYKRAGLTESYTVMRKRLHG